MKEWPLPLGKGSTIGAVCALIGLPLCGWVVASAGAPEMAVKPSSSTAQAGETALLPPMIASEGDPFLDDFETYDRERWFISHGWKNGDYLVNDWRRSQAHFDAPLSLTLEAGKSAESAYSSGEVQSRVKYGHGYFEATMRAAKGSGLVSAFFIYTGPTFGHPWNEVDVEIVGARPSEVLLTYHFEGQSHTHRHQAGFDTTEDFHTYGFDWQPGYIEWYIDGKPVFRATRETLTLPNKPQKMFLSLLGTQTLYEWAGEFDETAVPATALYTCAGYSRSVAEGKPCTDLLNRQN